MRRLEFSSKMIDFYNRINCTKRETVISTGRL